jgi:hypothetical protein
MVRRRRGSKRRGVGGRGVKPSIVSTPVGSNPQGDEKITEQKQVVVGDVVGMMRSFQRMSEALNNHLDRDEGKISIPNEGSQHDPVGSNSMHRELKKVKFLEFMGSTDGSVAEAWLDNMEMFFALRDYISNMKIRMVVF